MSGLVSVSGEFFKGMVCEAIRVRIRGGVRQVRVSYHRYGVSIATWVDEAQVKPLNRTIPKIV